LSPGHANRHSQTQKTASKLLKRIRAAVQAGKRKKTNWLVVEWLRSLEAKRLAVRLAYRAMPAHRRPERSDLNAIALHLDAWKVSGEVVLVGVRRKENDPNDLRYIMDFGIEQRALQYLVLLVLRELVELHPNQYGTRGTHQAIEQVKKAMIEGYVWANEFDMKDFYPSFNGKELWKFLPLPKKVIEAVLLGEHLNLKGGSSLLHLIGCEKDGEWWAHLLNDLLVEARRGMPQGSAASPFIAEALLSPTRYLIPKNGVIVAYADSIAATRGSSANGR
jgi:hypothetical protein